tara:strand:+ start:1037 stop:1732 length:696 start_codon:yes stop_codon:yes gene_type:complete
MEDKRKDEIVEDLLTTRPKGEEGQNPVYRDEEWFCDTAYKYKKKVECSHPGWGYIDDTLFALGIADEFEAARYLAMKFYGAHQYSLSKGKKTANSRRANRLWKRIGPGVDRVQTEGREGIYSLSKRYSSYTFGTVWAKNHEEALELGKMFYAYVIPDNERIQTKFLRLGDPTEVIPVNMAAIERLKNNIQEAKQRIEKLNNEIEEGGNQIQAIQLMQTHLVASASSHVDNG